MVNIVSYKYFIIIISLFPP